MLTANLSGNMRLCIIPPDISFTPFLARKGDRGMVDRMVRMSVREFERMVLKALDGLPPSIRQRMDNVDVVVDDWPSREDLKHAGIQDPYQLFGIYHGLPLTERSQYDMVLPDRIAIFRRSLEAACDTETKLADEIRITVLHEIAHHFGIDEAALKQTDYQ